MLAHYRRTDKMKRRAGFGPRALRLTHVLSVGQKSLRKRLQEGHLKYDNSSQQEEPRKASA